MIAISTYSMKRVYLILIIIGATVAVATPSIYLGVYFYSKKRLETTDVNVDDFEILGMTDNSLSGKVNFSLSKTTVVDATFRVTNATIAYETTIIGILQLQTVEFSAQEENHSTGFSLQITNSLVFNDFVSDFCSSSQLEIVLVAEIEFTGGLEALPKQTVTKTILLVGLQELSFQFNSFTLIEVTDTALHLSVSTTVNNPTAVKVNISSMQADIQMAGQPLGNITRSNFSITGGANVYLMDTWLTGSNATLSTLLGNYLSGENSSLTFNYTIVLASINSGFVYKSNSLPFILQGSQTALVSVDVEMITLDISGLPGSVAYTVKTTVTIHNPVNFEINITSFTGLLVYDDGDGAHYEIPFVATWDYTTLTNISLTPLDFNWTAAPRTISGEGSIQESFTFSGSNIEQGIRLYDEYYTKNQLYVDIINGEVTIQIGSFELAIPIEIHDIYVPNT
ncbi:MAG: hypothetical protein K9W42_06125 [Candidatus Heimdallarchaeota archaeon]|nr:hypothetical protein [Candidatus Heimdallarchaeota archaeon]